MNERIKDLLKQVRTQRHTENLMSNPPKVRYSYTIQENDLERFAQLIVRECVAAAEEAQADFYIVHNIKSHFGVKE